MSILILRGSASAVTAESEWAADSTAPGVTMATDFRTQGSVDDYVHQNGFQSRCVWDTTDKITGNGCLKINVLSTDETGDGAWRRSPNDAWVTDGQGFGSTPWYCRVRMKIPSNRLTPTVNGGGWKALIFGGYKPQSPNSSQSHTGHEIVINNFEYTGYPQSYREHPISGETGFYKDLGDGAFQMQSAVPACLLSDSSGCVFFPVDEWFTLYTRVETPSLGGDGAGNKWEAWFARAGATSYTKIFENFDFVIGSDATYPNGQNGIWLLTYDSGRTSAGFDTYQKYGQVIVSTQPIACPQV